MRRDYYEILGVARDADQTEIRKAFRTLARECHPDVNSEDPEAEARFKECAEAWEVLCDPEKRAAYDRYGFGGLRSQEMDPSPNVDFLDVQRARYGSDEFGMPLHPFFSYRLRLEEYLKRRAAEGKTSEARTD